MFKVRNFIDIENWLSKVNDSQKTNLTDLMTPIGHFLNIYCYNLNTVPNVNRNC